MGVFVQLFTCLAVVAFFMNTLKLIFQLRNNVHKARASGLQYVIVPWYMYNQFSSMVLNRYLLPFLKRLFPQQSVASWQNLLSSNWPLKLRHAPFKALGSDTFFTVAPGGLVLNTADAGLISQVLNRPEDFRKPVWIYSAIAIYGDNIVSSEGEQWKYHRKLTRMAFGERNNFLVWQATLDRAQDMVASFLGTDITSRTIQYVTDYTTRLSLEVIGTAALGQSLVWDHGEDDTFRDGYTMSFSTSLRQITSNVIQLAYIRRFPPWIQKRLPFASWRKSYEAYINWGSYMQEMISNRKQAVASGLHQNSTTTVDIIGQLCSGGKSLKGENIRTLTDSEILGNLFVFIIAGHETTASSILICLLLLALHPHIQQIVQKDLEELLQGRPPTTWNYEHDFPQLLSGSLGAVMNEEMRLVTPTLTIPKSVGPLPQTVYIDGLSVELPANTIIRLCIPSVHVNPNFWPHGPPTYPQCPGFATDSYRNDLEEFKPQRWTSHLQENANKLDHGEFMAKDRKFKKSTQLKAPVDGCFMPFSDGKRDCLGRKFAQIEIIAALAVILTQCSVELAVDEWATDEEVASMSKYEIGLLWQKAALKAHNAWQNHMVSGITVQLSRAKSVPLRFVRKGAERFYGIQNNRC